MILANLFALRTAVAAAIISLLGWIIYCRLFHPLRAIPGPYLASISRLWVVFKIWRGDMEHTQRTLHAKHGIDR